jgi:hypothetical protein
MARIPYGRSHVTFGFVLADAIQIYEKIRPLPSRCDPALLAYPAPGHGGVGPRTGQATSWPRSPRGCPVVTAVELLSAAETAQRTVHRRNISTWWWVTETGETAPVACRSTACPSRHRQPLDLALRPRGLQPGSASWRRVQPSLTPGSAQPVDMAVLRRWHRPSRSSEVRPALHVPPRGRMRHHGFLATFRRQSPLYVPNCDWIQRTERSIPEALCSVYSKVQKMESDLLRRPARRKSGESRDS